MRYTLDSSSLINAWRRTYPPDVFPGVWKKLGQLIERGVIVASDEVLEELKRKDDDLYEWAKRQPKMFVPPDAEIQRVVRDILEKFPKLIDTRRNRSGADPFVIATAARAQCAVVTEEKPSDNPQQKPHIPDVCQAYGVEVLPLLELLRKEGFVLKR